MKLEPVDHDPFAQSAQLELVDYDPFSEKASLWDQIKAGAQDYLARSSARKAVDAAESIDNPAKDLRMSPLGVDLVRSTRRISEPDVLKQELTGKVAEHAQAYQEHQSAAAETQLSPSTQRLIKAESFDDAWQAFTDEPLTVISELGARSLPASLPGLAIGSAAGLVSAPVGFAAGMGAGSGHTEYAASLMQALQEAGVDLSNPESIIEAIKNPDMMKEIRNRAATKALVVGGFDALSGGIASKTLAPSVIKNQVGRQTVNLPTQAGVQATLGAAGEAAGEYAATGEVNPGQIAAEAAGELFTAPVEVGGAALSAKLNKPTLELVDHDPFEQAIDAESEEIGQRQAVAALSPENAQMEVKEATFQPVEHDPFVQPESVVASRNAWAPGANYTGFVDDSTLVDTNRPDKPIRREDILRPFLKALNVPLYEGRVKGKGVLGFFLPKREAVRIKRKSDLEVAVHELAHLIDDRIPEIRQSWKRGPNHKIYRDELKGVSYDKKLTYEGFAEFVRLYMTQNDKAKALAPNYYQWFEGFTQRSEYGSAILKARDDMHTWFQQGALSRAKSKIGQQQDLNIALDGVFDSFRQSVSDDLHGIYRMERDLTGGIKAVGPYETSRLTRAAYSMVEGAMTLGAPVVNPNGSHSFKGKGLQQILDPLTGELENFMLYAVGRSAAELKTQGRENLFTLTEIQAMRELETPEFRHAFKEYQAWNNAILDFAQAKGLINPASRKLWKRAQYIPFHRSEQGQPTKREGAVEGNWNGIKRLTGGTANIRDVLGNIIQNASMLMSESLKNEARLKVAAMANQVRGGGRFMVRIPKDTKAVSIDKDQIHRFTLKMLGLDPAVTNAGMVPKEMVEVISALEEQFARQKDFMQFWIHGQAPRGDNIVAVMRRGKPEFYEVADPVLYRAFQSFNRPAKHWVVKFLSWFRRLGQASVTLTADFMAANVARDTLMGSIMSRHGFRPFLDSAKGFKSRLGKDPNYQEFIANGGGFASYLVDEDAFKGHLEKFYTQKGIDYRYVANAPSKVLFLLESLADAVEMSTRLGEFKRAREAGEQPRHAAYSAREVSTDFAMRGDSQVLSFFYDTVMFLKAGVNGMDRLYRGVAHDPNKAQIAAKTGILALMSMGLYALNRDNPLYDELEDWDKDTHWHFFIPQPDGSQLHFRYPKIWELGAVSSLAERTLEQVLNTSEGKGDGGKFAKDVFRVTTDLFKLGVIPQAGKPLYEQAVNKNTFTDRPIEPLALQGLQPFARAKTYTSATMRDIGMATRDLPRSLQVPPARAEALLRGYFNTWALYGLTLSDGLLYDDKPEMRVDRYPVFRRFYSGQPATHTKYGTQFYEMLREATELRRTLRHMDRINRPDVADVLEKRPELDEYRQLNFANNQVKAIKEEMRRVYIDPAMTPEQKRQRIDELTQEKNSLLQQVVEEVRGR